jgi:hypothetical protein
VSATRAPFDNSLRQFIAWPRGSRVKSPRGKADAGALAVAGSVLETRRVRALPMRDERSCQPPLKLSHEEWVSFGR